jgi:hypothetical protein
MAYTTRAKVEAAIPANLLGRGISQENFEVDGLLDTLIGIADQEIDGYGIALSENNAATFSLVLTCDLIYRRNQTPDQVNPWAKRSDDVRKMLQDAADGKIDLNDTETAQFAGVFDDPARVFNLP